MTEDKKVIALVDEEDVAAIMYHYVGEVRRFAAPDAANGWNPEADAEVRRLIQKANYFADLLDELDQKKKQQPATVTALPQKASGE